MMKNLKQSKGITLIALVVTILVLLILAGVAISMLAGDNGIINKTNSAKAENEKATEEEQVKLAVLAALTTGNGEIVSNDAFTILQDELKKAGCKNSDSITSLPATVEMEYKSYDIDEYGKVSVSPTIEDLKGGEAVDTTKTLKDTEGKQVVIPAEFKIAEDSASFVKDGIVVIAPDGSEFVWVPVEDINSMVMCQSHNGVSDCKIGMGDDGKLKCENHADTLICGKLYAESTDTIFDEKLITQKYQARTGIREPALLPSTSKGDKSTTEDRGLDLLNKLVGINNINDWEFELQDEFEKMAKSVYENKGFYVGRYETSLKTLDDGITKVAQSRANKLSATGETTVNGLALTWYGLYQKEKEYSTQNSLTEIVGSTMIWGSQYDQMMLWMTKNGYNVKSSNSEQLNNAKKNNNTNGVTGPEGDEDLLNNIYDLLGGKYEWTLEADYTDSRVHRSGYCYGDTITPPSVRTGVEPYKTSKNYSSRVSLYIK